MFAGPLSESLLGKAQGRGLVEISVHNFRDLSRDKHRKVDDKPFGGGAGMLLKVEPIYNTLKKLGAITKPKKGAKPYVIYLSPQGKTLNQTIAKRLSKKNRLILICGHYEGIDERAMRWVDAEISIGDFVLTGGELPAMVVSDAVCRMVPGVVKEWESVERDSFFNRALDCSQYTRPKEFLGMKVPRVLLSGNHKDIECWRSEDSIANTRKKRPDLAKNF